MMEEWGEKGGLKVWEMGEGNWWEKVGDGE